MSISSSVERVIGRALTRRFIVSNLLVPLGVALSYFASASLLLPPGVSNVFVTRSMRYAAASSIPLVIGLAVLAGLGKIRPDGPHPSSERPSPSDVVILLFPLTPVLQYILKNGDILSWLDSVVVLSVFLVLISIPILAVPTLLAKIGSARALMYLGLAFAYSITNMASLSARFAWHEWGSLKIQLPIFASVWLVGWFLFRIGQRGALHLAVAVFFLMNSMLQLQNDARSSASPATSDRDLAEIIGSRRPVAMPNIYLLVYDGYVVSETLSNYGIDNSSHERYLEELDFTIYPHTYSVGGTSLTTMSRTLNYTEPYSPGVARKGVSGDGNVQNLLKSFGYRTYGIFPSTYFFRGVTPHYDYSYPGYGSPAGLLVRAILEGEFRFDIGFDEISRIEFINEKVNILGAVEDDPKFVYTHSDLPGHSQNSGQCLPNETEMYGERLVRANLEMRRDIESIVYGDPQAIIIVAGDHGPYLTKNCTGTGYQGAYEIHEISRPDIQDRLGAFLAVRWPSDGSGEYDDITILQDIFPSIFAYMFRDARLLETQMEHESYDEIVVSGVEVVDGVIVGGINDGEPLFLDGTD